MPTPLNQRPLCLILLHEFDFSKFDDLRNRFRDPDLTFVNRWW